VAREYNSPTAAIKSQMKVMEDSSRSDSSLCSEHDSNSNFCSLHEERDEYGEVIQVADLKFTDQTLGSGSYATVALAQRIHPSEPNPLSPSTKQTKSFNHHHHHHQHTNFSAETGTFNPDISCCRQSMSVAAVTNPENEQEFVAVKIFSKSLLKRMRNIKRSKNHSRHNDESSNHHRNGTFVEIHTALGDVEREIALLKMFRHPNVVSLLQVIDCEESDSLYVVLEYIPLGEIMTFDPEMIRFYHRHPDTPGLIKCTNGPHNGSDARFGSGSRSGYSHFTEEYAALFFVDVLHGLAYLHRNFVCHRDLKPENVLLTQDGIAKISDFGVSHYFEEEKSATSRNLISDDCKDYGRETSPPKLTRYDTDSALEMNRMNKSGLLKNTEGTVPFWSPEMCNASTNSFSGYTSDVWAAGICLYIFASGQLPFYSDSVPDLINLISDGNVLFEATSFSEELKDLLAMVLNKDPNERAGIGECLKHDFCKNARNKRIRMLGVGMNDDEKKLEVRKVDTQRAFSVARLVKVAKKSVSTRLNNAKKMFTSSSRSSDPSSSSMQCIRNCNT